jgi:hypothetical protein
MATKINDFISKIGQGTKPNMFAIDIVWPTDLGSGNASPSGDDKDLVDLLCKSAALPASALGVIEVPFRGRTVKISGDRTFDTWSPTFFNDKDLKVRSYFEQWLETMNTHNGNNAPKFRPSTDATAGYMATVRVKQLEKNATEKGTILRQYTLHHAFPTNVSQIDLGYDSNDQISEFSVEFQYSYWTVDAPVPSNITDGAATGIAGTTRLVNK